LGAVATVHGDDSGDVGRCQGVPLAANVPLGESPVHAALEPGGVIGRHLVDKLDCEWEGAHAVQARRGVLRAADLVHASVGLEQVDETAAVYSSCGAGSPFFSA
jgi:hypothetical protein